MTIREPRGKLKAKGVFEMMSGEQLNRYAEKCFDRDCATARRIMAGENKRRKYSYEVDDPESVPGPLHFHAENGLGDVVDFTTNHSGEGLFVRERGGGYFQTAGTTQFQIPTDRRGAEARLRRMLSRAQFKRIMGDKFGYMLCDNI